MVVAFQIPNWRIYMSFWKALLIVTIIPVGFIVIDVFIGDFAIGTLAVGIIFCVVIGYAIAHINKQKLVEGYWNFNKQTFINNLISGILLIFITFLKAAPDYSKFMNKFLLATSLVLIIFFAISISFKKS